MNKFEQRAADLTARRAQARQMLERKNDPDCSDGEREYLDRAYEPFVKSIEDDERKLKLDRDEHARLEQVEKESAPLTPEQKTAARDGKTVLLDRWEPWSPPDQDWTVQRTQGTHGGSNFGKYLMEQPDWADSINRKMATPTYELTGVLDRAIGPAINAGDPFNMEDATDEQVQRYLLDRAVASSNTGTVITNVEEVMTPRAKNTFAMVVPRVAVDRATFGYRRVTTQADAAAPQAQNAQLADDAIEWTLENATTVRIGFSVKVSNQAMMSETALNALVQDEMMKEVQEVVDEQIADGSGTAPNMLGIMNYPTTGGEARDRIGTTAFPTAASGDASFRTQFADTAHLRATIATFDDAYGHVEDTGHTEMSHWILRTGLRRAIKSSVDDDGRPIYRALSDEGSSNLWGDPMEGSLRLDNWPSSGSTSTVGVCGDFMGYSRFFTLGDVQMFVSPHTAARDDAMFFRVVVNGIVILTRPPAFSLLTQRRS